MTAHHPPHFSRRTLLTHSVAAATAAGLLQQSQGLSASQSPSPGASPVALNDHVSQLVAGNTSFALDLYHQLRELTDGNLVFSPYSVSVALAMAYVGASGETADQIASTLSFPDDTGHTAGAFHTLTSDLLERGNGDSDDGKRELRVAEAVWSEQSWVLSDSYIETIGKDFEREIHPVDFTGDPDEAREEINDWVAEKTNDRIETLVPDGVIDDHTRVVLASAIYFSNSWQFPFNADDTEDDTFHLLDGTTIDTAFMSQDASIPYVKTGQAQVVELPYIADGFGMTIILPDEGQFEMVEDRLDSDMLQTIVDGLEPTDVQLSLPKFGFDVAESLVETLKSLGMIDAFDPDAAEFGAMVEDGSSDELAISHILHEAFVTVDEAGTEAAGATAVVVGVTSAQPSEDQVTLQVNRPFLFAIRDSQTGTLLFLGRVIKPGVDE